MLELTYAWLSYGAVRKVIGQSRYCVTICITYCIMYWFCLLDLHGCCLLYEIAYKTVLNELFVVQVT